MITGLTDKRDVGRGRCSLRGKHRTRCTGRLTSAQTRRRSPCVHKHGSSGGTVCSVEAVEGKAHSCRRATLTHVHYIIVATVLNVARPSLRELLSRSSITCNTIIDVRLNLRLRRGVGGVGGGGIG